MHFWPNKITGRRFVELVPQNSFLTMLLTFKTGAIWVRVRKKKKQSYINKTLVLSMAMIQTLGVFPLTLLGFPITEKRWSFLLWNTVCCGYNDHRSVGCLLTLFTPNDLLRMALPQEQMVQCRRSVWKRVCQNIW